MDEIDRRVIQIYIEKLAKDTNFDLLWDKLLAQDSSSIITPFLKEKFQELRKGGTSDYERNKQLYEDIQTKGKNAFGVLVKCLQEVHPDLAQLLLPTNESIPAAQEDSPDDSGLSMDSENESPQCRGYCIVGGPHKEKTEVHEVITKLCQKIHAKLIPVIEDVDGNTAMAFILLINLMDELTIMDREGIPDDKKLIIINIKKNQQEGKPFKSFRWSQRSEGSLDSQRSESSQDSLQAFNSEKVFIINIYIHAGDHVPSVLNIIKEIIANNPNSEIRDICHIAADKLGKWGCRVNTESRSFPKFIFCQQT